jgi:ABC-type multidrug transport system fused ATPase/permease subunit
MLLLYLRPLWRRLLLLAAALALSLVLELANPQLVRAFLDAAEARQPLAVLLRLAGLFLLAAVVLQLSGLAETYLAADVGLHATNRLRADLALHVLRLDLTFHNARTPGELIERVDGDVAALGNFFSRFVVHLAGNALLLVGVLLLYFRLDWRIGLAMTLFAGLSLSAIYAVRDIAVPHWAGARQARASLFGFIEENLASIEDICANGAGPFVLRGLSARSRALLERERLASLVSSGSAGLTTLLFALGTALGLGLSAVLFQSGALTLGAVYLVFTYSVLLSRPIEQITRQLQDLQQAGASLARVQALLAERPSLTSGGHSLPAGPLSVEFDGVSFAYQDAAQDNVTLSDLSFSLPPGAVLGLLGRTGSGKTTLIRLLFRFYDPTRGVVRLGGQPLPGLRLDDLRRRVGMVTQDIQLFHAPVRDNLTFFDRAIPDDRILDVLRELGLWDWYASLPHRLDTRLAPGGAGLSAGQAQLLAFARVFLKDPAVVILDEASSRLDPATEQRLERAVDRLLAGRTAIIIAHRLGTVQRADAILILEQGRVLEHGPRAQLAADPASRFAQLLRAGRDEVLA